jgi:hypothetical protein
MMREVLIALKLTDLGMTLWAAVAGSLARQRDAYGARTAEAERRNSDEWFQHWVNMAQPWGLSAHHSSFLARL